MNINYCYTEGHNNTNNKLSVERGNSNLGVVVVVELVVELELELTVVKKSQWLLMY